MLPDAGRSPTRAISTPAWHPIHCTLHAIELETLADHHDVMATGMRRGDSGAADLMEARAAELRRWAAKARAGA
jgi:hypothetical protein